MDLRSLFASQKLRVEMIATIKAGLLALVILTHAAMKAATFTDFVIRRDQQEAFFRGGQTQERRRHRVPDDAG